MTTATNQQGSVLLSVEGLRHVYGSEERGHVAIDGLEFEVREGEFVSIVGPSGCGKTTLLKCTSGLLRSSHGHVRLGGTEFEDVPEELALVFQDYSRSLFPWMTVRANVNFPLGRQGLSRADRQERVEASVDAVGLSGFDDYHPWQLSGGMQQRVAIARALAYRPKILLMDEPFASVDAQTRADLEDLILDVRRRFDMTILFVTHDIDESVYLADRVLVLSNAPARVIADIAVPLPHPRDQIETKELDEFIHIRGEVARLIRSAGQRAGQEPTDAQNA
jgi:NitT/TauT family transport system ATP-binding protein